MLVDLKPQRDAIKSKYREDWWRNDEAKKEFAALLGEVPGQGHLNEHGVFIDCHTLKIEGGIKNCYAHVDYIKTKAGYWVSSLDSGIGNSWAASAPGITWGGAYTTKEEAIEEGLEEALRRCKARDDNSTFTTAAAKLTAAINKYRFQQQNQQMSLFK